MLCENVLPFEKVGHNFFPNKPKEALLHAHVIAYMRIYCTRRAESLTDLLRTCFLQKSGSRDYNYKIKDFLLAPSRLLLRLFHHSP